MELLLEACSATWRTGVDASVDLEPDDPAGELASALWRAAADVGAAPAEAPAKLGLRLVRTGAVLGPADAIGPSGLATGDIVEVVSRPVAARARRPPAAAGGAVTVDLRSGPDAGRSVSLPPGRHLLGRGSGSRLRIDDPALSREHALLDVHDDGTVVIDPNPAAVNGTWVAGRELDGPVVLEPGQEVFAGGTVLALAGAARADARPRDRLGQIPFNPTPYRRPVPRVVELERVPAPPAPLSPSPGALVAIMAPVLGGLLLAVLLRRPEYLLLTVLGPIGGLYQRRGSKKLGRRTYAQQRERFLAKVEARRVQLAEAVAEERRVRLEASPDVAALAREAQLLQLRLWERPADSPNLLELRLGRLPSLVRAEVDKSANDEELTDWAMGQLSATDIEGAPITLDLNHLVVAGLHGDRPDVEAALAALLTQASALHSPEDLAVAAALRPDGVEDLGWVKWLPHARTSTSPLEGPHVVVGQAATNQWLVRLLGVAADRLERARGDASFDHRPKLLAVIHEQAQPDRALLSQLLEVAPAVGIVVLWVGVDEHQLPRQCAAVVACGAAGTASRVWFTDPDRDPRDLDPEWVRQETAAAIARSLAPLRDAGTASVTTAIPRRVTLFEALELPEPSASELVARWSGGAGYQLQAALGVGADGILRLDLVQQGPHALIAGTSGSGKSELLQTLVAALASAHPPDRCTFLFIDYKGGASSAEFRDLPHSVGYVTNLDGRLSLRALTSLRAELSRRMAILEGRAKDLEELLQVAPQDAPPSLVIIVDEFATLVKEIPDFVAGIVDIAQRGRSLGIHLVLATQRPTGAVNDNILANTNLRISLRVLDPADSVSVINAPDAADIPVPLRGRGFVRTGPRELRAFQCAWSGAPFTVTRRAVTAEPWLLPGQAGVLPSGTTAPGQGHQSDDPTQLEVLVAAAAEAAKALELEPPRKPWVEPLPALVPLSGVLDRVGRHHLSADPGRLLVLGLLDDPANQAQEPALVDLEQTGGLVVYGGGGAGKTTALRTIAAGLAQQGGTDGVLLYAIDFANRALDQLRPLPHCAGVAMGDDPEAVTRLLTVLTAEVDRRRRLLAEAQAESLSALREQAGEVVLPRIVLLLDGYGAFHAAFDQGTLFEWVQRAQKLVAEGRQVGVHFVLTADRRTAIPPALLAAISARFVLRMADVDDMAVLGVPLAVARSAELEPGRGFLNGTTEVQLACASTEHRGAAQAAALAELGAELRESTAPATPLPALPEAVRARPSALGRLQPVLGLADLSLDPVVADLRRGHLVVTGPPESGRSSVLLTVALGLHSSGQGRPWLVGLGRPDSPLANLGTWDDAGFTAMERSEVADRLAAMLAEADGRSVEVVVVVDQAEDTEDQPVAGILERVVRSDAARVVVACDVGSLGRTFGGGWLQEAKRARTTLVLQPEDRNQVDALAGVRPSLRPGQTFPPGRGIYVRPGGPLLVQVSLSD